MFKPNTGLSGLDTLWYSFFFSHCRNVGFLNYWELKQAPNFLLASPMLILSLCGIKSYLLRYYRNRQTQHTTSHRGQQCSQAEIDSHDRLLPFIVVWGILVVTGLLFIHVQVITRFLSSCPPVYWFAASLFLEEDDDENSRRSGDTKEKKEKETTAVVVGGTVTQRMLLWYFLGYSLLGCILFPNFYPWT